MPLEPEPDLHWTAFLYASGDLPPDQASSFELRLADDQEARDALAGAVDLAEALVLVGPEFRTRRRVGRRLALIGLSSLAAAACLVLALTLRGGPKSTEPLDASEVALAWSVLRGDGDPEGSAFPQGLAAPEPLETGPVAGPEADHPIDSPADRPLPSWLLSAASAPLEDSPRVED